MTRSFAMGSRGPQTPGDFLPTASPASLRRRADLLRRLRAFFDSREFLEVETPLLSADSVVDRHLDPLSVTLFGDPRQPAAGPRLWLQTSPEFGMKRLLAAGYTAIYQVTRAFRGGECGPWHNPEFTMVEWYRVGDGYEQGMRLLGDLVQALLDRGEPERITYREAFLRAVSMDPFAAATEQLAEVCRDQGLQTDQPWSTDEPDPWLDWLMSSCVAPRLGRGRPVIVCDFPPAQAALARVRQGPVPAAERFELFVDGIELANGYHELLEPDVLRQRQHIANVQRAREGKFALPEENRLLQAMEYGLPPCTGVALGLDRLVMVACGAATLAEVIAFPVDRA